MEVLKFLYVGVMYTVILLNLKFTLFPDAGQLFTLLMFTIVGSVLFQFLLKSVNGEKELYNYSKKIFN
ncbi:hypothetical protein VPBG_00171 [Vibrio phage helene 12B3]|uniref:hypothetical protein n=1 Tax=Vibrio phage helene 12B3 TaxID=573173 RepID=UPI0002C09EB1|nr:hypothetical protein VPBG_00171 [Vibrio phage helene 12B3]YP_009223041.1 hypothetical protein VPLG_00192 [Vibrio phage eugene 12A10]AGG57943.1 hypothetical protein VPBG_00171 [Vibrio phage helene 12B3]AGN51631.1 hypothetical protein VPLG_00192 [Vibrio phage eugene 12A10]